jgi:hypothetical protein
MNITAESAEKTKILTTGGTEVAQGATGESIEFIGGLGVAAVTIHSTRSCA